MLNKNLLYTLNYILLIIIYLGPLFITGTESVRVCKTFADYFFENDVKCWNNTDAESNVTEIIEKWGYTAQEHYVKTDDGYEILVVRVYSVISRTTPIVLGHGIYMNSLGYVSMGNKSLTYILSTLGYDVWLINFRGTRYSSKHDSLTTDDVNYWNFSFHEMGIFDLRKVLDLIFTTTNQKAIYVGFSMGSSASYIYSSTFPEEAKQRLKGIISLAPIAYLNDIKSVLRIGAPIWPLVKPFMQFIGKGKVLPRNDNALKFCAANPISMYICEVIKAPILGPSFDQMDPEYKPVTNILNPDTVGINVVTHYAQIINSGQFQKLDYGKTENLAIYGTATPPLYSISNITVPLSLFVGLNDYLATESNANRLCSEAINSQCSITILDNEKWSHSDFVTAKNIKPLLNYPVSLEIARIELEEQNTNSV